MIDRIIMKKIACILILVLALIGTGSAYIIKCDCPDMVAIGEPLDIKGTSTLNAGLSYDVSLYRNKPSIMFIGKKTITIQDSGYWSVYFSTDGLEPGQYKLEVGGKENADDFGSGSDCTYDKPKIFTVVDRSAGLEITSPMIQDFNGILSISGRDEEIGDSGIELTVRGSSGVIYGPTYIRTDSDGEFAQSVSISEGGIYTVTFSDLKGFIANVDFKVNSPFVPTTIIPTGRETTQATKMYASAQASRDNPAFFAVDSKPGTLVVTTSYGIDWVVEYTDGSTQPVKVNEQGTLSAEILKIPVSGGMMYLKVYPAMYSDSGMVSVYAENADSLSASPSAATFFGDAPPVTSTQESPVSVPVIFLAFVIICLFVRKE